MADSVTEWNERALACTVAAKQLPYVATRAMAMVHVAMFDAANSVEHRYTAYRVQASARPGSFAEAAVAAAHSVLLKLFPDQRADVDAGCAASMARIPDDGKAGGVAVGEKVAADIISLRENDGAEAPNQYRPITVPGAYVMTKCGERRQGGIDARGHHLAKCANHSETHPSSPRGLFLSPWVNGNRLTQLGSIRHFAILVSQVVWVRSGSSTDR